MKYLGDILILSGFLCVAVGATFVYRPAGLIITGIELLFLGHVLEARGAKK